MAIASPAEIAAALGAGSQPYAISKAAIANQLAGGYCSLFRATGTPAQGSIPSTAAVCDKTLTGALLNQVNASGNDARGNPKKNYLGPIDLIPSANTPGTIIVVDRLAHMGGLSGTSTSSQTVGVDVSGAGSNMASRINQTDYTDVRWFIEIYTDVGTTAVTATITYTNAAGTTGRTTTMSFAGASPANRAGRMFEIIPTNNGSEKIESIQSLQNSATTGTAGSFGITALKWLGAVPQNLVGGLADVDMLRILREAGPDACLVPIAITGTTSSPVIAGTGYLITG